MICQICGKAKKRILNRPHSLKRSKRTVYPNLQKVNGLLVCSRCRRTMLKKGIV